MSYTLFFEEIAKTTSIVNKDSIPRWPTSGHANATDWQTSITFRKGRYGQTKGNRIGDISPGMNACLYHMPRNSYRFEEARLKVHKKNIGDPIQASDINNLIDKIKLFQHIWEAEANNIEAYGPVGVGADTISASISNNWNSVTTIKTAAENGSLKYSLFSSDDTKGKYDPTCYIYINGVEQVRSTAKNQTLSGTLSFNKNDEIKLYIDRGPSAHPNITATLYYNGVGGLLTASNNIAVSTTPLKYINSDGGEVNNFPMITRNVEVSIPKEEIFACVTGDSSNAVLVELYRHRSDGEKVGSKFNNPLMYGFPEFLDNFDVTNGEHGSGGYVNTGEIINCGHAPIAAVAPIMFKEDGKISPHYKLKYLSGDNVNTIVKDRYGTDIIFKSDVPQIYSYRRDNQPDTKLFYFGYIVYYLASTDESALTGLVDNEANNMIIFERDYTYIKPRVFVGGNYPLIYGNDFKSVKTVLKDYLHAILVTSQLGINCGTPDSATMMELNAFFGSQDATGNAFDRDNPETTFVGYHALSGGIIKLDFYNILVDAYKLLINSCICNADCACNLVCICNTNCGCNYSG